MTADGGVGLGAGREAQALWLRVRGAVHSGALARRGLVWLDQPDGGVVLAWDPVEELRGPRADVLDALQARARAEPDHVWIGVVTYDAAARWLAGELVAGAAPHPSTELPGVWFRRFARCFVVPVDAPAAWAAAVQAVDAVRASASAQGAAHGPAEGVAQGSPQGHATATTQPADASAGEPSPPDGAVVWPFGALVSERAEPDYIRSVERVKAWIVEGDCYQVNLSHRLHAAAAPACAQWSVARQAVEAFAVLRARGVARFGALIDAGPRWIVSDSPELLIETMAPDEADETAVAAQSSGLSRCSDDSDPAEDSQAPAAAPVVVLASEPIKGTRPRGRTPDEDAALRAQLVAAAKDAAEHVMIVDLVRNDLGRIAAAGSVRAPRSPNVMTLPTVHHLVSRVTCVRPAEVGLRATLESVMPAGSITGAPKRRAVQRIAELEREQRGVYCGALGWVRGDAMRLSIPIRTAVVMADGLWLRSGGGVVIDSDARAEWHETLDKARAFAGQ